MEKSKDTMPIQIDWKNIGNYLAFAADYRMIDKVEIRSNERAVAHKAVSAMDWYFRYHFPGCLLVPGSFLVEMMKQTAEVFAAATLPDGTGYQHFECSSFRIFRAVRPGDMLEITVECRRAAEGTLPFTGKVKNVIVDDENIVTKNLVCSMAFSLLSPTGTWQKPCPADTRGGPENETGSHVQNLVLDRETVGRYAAFGAEYSFLDVVHTIPGEKAWGTKKLTQDDWFFAMNVSPAPAMPDGLLMEVLMQAGNYIITTLPGMKNDPILFQGCEYIRICGKAYPGDVLRSQATTRYFNRGIAKFEGTLYCQRGGVGTEHLIGEMSFMAVLPDELARLAPDRKEGKFNTQ